MKNKIIQGDCLEVLKTLPDESVDMVMTSPPYWALRDYGVDGQFGLEPTFEEYINKLCDIFDEVKRVLKKTGTCWVNMGDTYSGGGTGGQQGRTDRTKEVDASGVKKIKTTLSDKCLLQIPNRFAIEMTNRGWILRNELIWHKPNCMPSSAKDRFTVDFEKIFFFTKSKKYWFKQQTEALKEVSINRVKYGWHRGKDYPDKANVPEDIEIMGNRFAPEQGRNKRCVWKITTKPFKDAHFAVYPEKLCWTPIKAGCPVGGIVLDPFLGAGTTAVVAQKLNRKYIGIELNPEYIKIAESRLKQETLL